MVSPLRTWLDWDVVDKIIKTPYMADSITQGTLASWEKKIGDIVKQDDQVANIETDKVTIPVNAPEAGIIKEFFAKTGDTVEVGSNLFRLELQPEEAAPSKAKVSAGSEPSTKRSTDAARPSTKPIDVAGPPTKPIDVAGPPTKQIDVAGPPTKPVNTTGSATRPVTETRERLTRMRARIAERMKEAQNTTASLTTFNDLDMTALVNLRSRYKEAFGKKYGAKLGYMSAFVKACAMALTEMPVVNARLDMAAGEIVYHSHVDISVAGLVTPVLRNCEAQTFAQIESTIQELGELARDNKIALDALAGGTFTISNGGVFGSLMGTPIINAPQSAILGMHAIKDRPVVVDGKIEIRPMMYLALTYDHRLIDGREAVTFLVRVKELLEDPQRMLVNV